MTTLPPHPSLQVHWGCWRHVITPVEDGLATSSDQQYATTMSGGWGVIHEALFTHASPFVPTPTCPSLGFTKMYHPRASSPCISRFSADAPGLEERYVIYLCSIIYINSRVIRSLYSRSLAATRPLPSNQGCGPNLKQFRMGVWVRGKWEMQAETGPCGWSARYVRWWNVVHCQNRFISSGSSGATDDTALGPNIINYAPTVHTAMPTLCQ